MTPWTCAGCQCEYNWTYPHVYKGTNFCDICIDNDEKTSKVSGSKKQSISGSWWFLLGIVVGIIIAKFIVMK